MAKASEEMKWQTEEGKREEKSVQRKTHLKTKGAENQFEMK